MNESSILFSVVIPVYNSEDYIEQLLRHFVTQNNNRFEVIVVDDGSKDNSLSICQKVSEQNDFIVVLSQRNQGASAARNYGLRNARGKYIVFVDSDDSITDDYVSALTQICETNNSDLIQLNWLQGSSEEGYKPAYTDLVDCSPSVKEYCCELLQQKFNPPWNKVYKRSLSDRYGIIFNTNMVMGEDLEFTIKYVNNIQSVSINSRYLYKYFLNADGLCARASLSYFSDLRKIYDAMQKLVFNRSFDRTVLLYADESIVASVFRSIGSCMQSGFSPKEIKGEVKKTGFIDLFGSMKKLSIPSLLRKDLVLLGFYNIIALLFKLKNGSNGRV